MVSCYWAKTNKCKCYNEFLISKESEDNILNLMNLVIKNYDYYENWSSDLKKKTELLQF